MTDIAIYPPAHSSTYVKATSYSDTLSYPHYATDPALSLTGTSNNTCWKTPSGTVTNQKFNIAYAHVFVATKLRIDNFHTSGIEEDRGIANVLLYGTNESTAFDNTTYTTTTDLTLLETLVIDAHTAVDEADPQDFTIDTSTAYQYYVLRIADNNGDASYMGIRHIELFAEQVGATIGGGIGFSGIAAAESDGAIGKGPPVMVGNIGFGCAINAITQVATIDGGIGFSSDIFASSNIITFNTSIRFNTAIEAIGTVSIDVGTGIRFGSIIQAQTYNDVDNINSSLGFGCTFNSDFIHGNIDSSIGFGSIIDIFVTTGIDINASIRFGSNITTENSNSCTIPDFSSNRWY